MISQTNDARVDWDMAYVCVSWRTLLGTGFVQIVVGQDRLGGPGGSRLIDAF